MPPRHVDELRVILQALTLVDGWREKLRAVDLVLVEGLAKLAARNERRGGAKARHDTAAEAEASHAEAFEVVGLADLFGEPA
jgi:hypothetical protein